MDCRSFETFNRIKSLQKISPFVGHSFNEVSLGSGMNTEIYSTLLDDPEYSAP
jgi:hypothetical protein